MLHTPMCQWAMFWKMSEDSEYSSSRMSFAGESIGWSVGLKDFHGGKELFWGLWFGVMLVFKAHSSS